MPWIRVVEEHEAQGDVVESYNEFRDQMRKVMSLRGGNFLRRLNALERAITLGGSCLGRTREEAIAVVVSSAMGCKYSAVTHGELLRAEVASQVDDAEAWVARLRNDYRSVGLSYKDVAMLDYALKITWEPDTCDEEDIERLRSFGWTDREILDIVLLAAYHNFMARIASALGVVPGADI